MISNRHSFRLWPTPESFVRFSLPISRWSVPGQVTFEAMYANACSAGRDAVAEQTVRMIESMAVFEERQILCSTSATTISPESAYPTHVDPRNFVLGGSVVPPMEAGSSNMFGLLAQMAMPGSRATIRVTPRSDLLKGLVSMLVEMIAEKDALPDTIAVSSYDISDLQFQMVHSHGYSACMPESKSGWAQFNLGYLYHLADYYKARSAVFALNRHGPDGPKPIFPIMVAPHMPKGHVLALSSAWPKHWKPGEFLIQREEHAPVEVVQQQDPTLLQFAPTSPTYRMELMAAGVVCCHAPFLQGWLEVKN